MKAPKRRDFLKGVALAGTVAPAASAPAENSHKAPSDIAYPRKYTGRAASTIAFPLGGVGAGSISLGGRGQLRDWEIFNKPDKGNTPENAFALINASVGSQAPVTSVLESKLVPPYEGYLGLGTTNAPGFPRLESATFTGEYPLARIDFADPALPVEVSLEAFTPFVPLDADESGLPVAVLRYRVANPGAAKARVGIAFAISNPCGPSNERNQFKTRANEHRKGDWIEGLLMRSLLPADDPFAGSFVLAVLAAGEGKVTWLRGWRGPSRFRGGALEFWEDLASDGELGPEAPSRNTAGSLCLTRDIAPGAQADFTFLLSWHFPNRTAERCGWKSPKGEERTIIGNWYSRRFSDAWNAAEYAAANLPRLEKSTRQFVEAIRHTTMPGAVLDAATANLSTFASTTCFRTADGAFHGFEGSEDSVGSCFGNCTHVWNYEAATPHLFPTLSRSLREAAFGFCTSESGAQDFRQLLPANKEIWGHVAADGQMGSIMKLYLDWRLSGDNEWLSKHWPAAKRAVQYAWIPNGWDADRDGVIEGVQHNTYDVELYGPNPVCSVWYLGALRAAEEMSRAMGDGAFGDECRRLFVSGSKWIDTNLFNGEYYIQKVRGMPKDSIPKEQMGGVVRTDPENPDFQFGEGCMADQLVGQYLADIAGLGDLLNPAKMRKALESIARYNYKPSLRNYVSAQRTFVLNDDAALVLCDFTAGWQPKIPFPYWAEAWAGVEYSTAALMMSRGLVAEALRVVESVRRRHDGVKRNPWNEPECGHHYARAMAAWAPLVLLSGFRYDAPGKRVLAKPLLNSGAFTSFWSSGTGWGVFSLKSQGGQLHFKLSVRGGELALRTVILPGTAAGSSRVRCGNQVLTHEVTRAGSESKVAFSADVKVAEGEELIVVV